MAGALWGPWLVEPRHRVLRWAEHTLTTLRDLAARPGTGLRLASGIDVSDVPHSQLPLGGVIRGCWEGFGYSARDAHPHGGGGGDGGSQDTVLSGRD